MSTVIGTFICIPLFGFEPSWLFAFGACIVLSSALLYGEAFKFPYPECDRILFDVPKAPEPEDVEKPLEEGEKTTPKTTPPTPIQMEERK